MDQGPSIAERYLYLTHDPETVVPLLSIAFALLVLVILYVAYAARGFAAYAGDLRQRLAAAQFDTRVEEIAPPPPLMRDFALRNGGRPGGPGLIEVRQTAELATAPGKSFFPLRARQTTGTRRAGFVWTASGTMPPGIPVSGLDAYVDTGARPATPYFHPTQLLGVFHTPVGDPLAAALAGNARFVVYANPSIRHITEVAARHDQIAAYLAAHYREVARIAGRKDSFTLYEFAG